METGKNIYDLTKVEDRKKFVKDCETKLVEELKQVINLSETAIANISSYNVELGICSDGEGMDFASEITIYVDRGEINYGTSGGFAPKTNHPSYWRTVHAGEVVSNWEKVLPIFKKYVDMYNILTHIPVDKTQD